MYKYKSIQYIKDQIMSILHIRLAARHYLIRSANYRPLLSSSVQIIDKNEETKKYTTIKTTNNNSNFLVPLSTFSSTSYRYISKQSAAEFVSELPPVQFLDSSITFLHDTLSIEWSSTVILLAFLFRLGVGLPIKIHKDRLTSKRKKIKLDIMNTANKGTTIDQFTPNTSNFRVIKIIRNIYLN
jgi:hypothetical protein